MKSTVLACVLVVGMIVQGSGCGTLFFAERQNQANSNKLDPNILILDGIGLLFFILPGLVAFGVDFVTETIYLPVGVERGEGPFIHDKGGDS